MERALPAPEDVPSPPPRTCPSSPCSAPWESLLRGMEGGAPTTHSPLGGAHPPPRTCSAAALAAQ